MRTLAEMWESRNDPPRRELPPHDIMTDVNDYGEPISFIRWGTRRIPIGGLTRRWGPVRWAGHDIWIEPEDGDLPLDRSRVEPWRG